MLLTGLIAGQAQRAAGAKKDALAAGLAQGRAVSTASDAKLSDSGLTEEAAQARQEAKAARRRPIDDAKSQAKARMQQLIELLKMVRKLYAEDPKAMARQLASIAKELKAVVKQYGEAAKAGAAVLQAELSAAGSSLPPDAAAAEREALNGEAKAVAMGDLDFISNVRSLGQDMRDLLTRARTKATLTLPERFERSEDYEAADRSLRELHEGLDDLDSDLRQAWPPGALLKLEA